ncbi:hypothetical protein ACFL0B_07710 [Thermodesulfobacteriota bacterium]
MNDLFPVNSDQIMKADRLESKAVAKMFEKKPETQEFSASTPKNKPDEKKISTAEQVQGLFDMTNDRCEFFNTPDHEPYATIIHKKHADTVPLRSRKFGRFITRLNYEKTGKPPSKRERKETLDLCEAVALFDGPEREVHTRIAFHEGAIYIDLANDLYEQAKITKGGYEVISSKLSPVRFIRTPRMAPMCRPEPGGSLLHLRDFINAEDDSDWILIVAWLIGALHPSGPFPILLLQGEQGSAKSTIARLLIDLIDPSTIPLCTSPRSERDLFISASKTRVMSFDNLSGISDQLSDAFCRMATGGGLATRSLFTDDSEKLFNSKRPVIINGIADLLTRHDFTDRSIVINTAPIPQNKRKPEKEIWGPWQKVKPLVLGALCTAVSTALRTLDSIQLDTYPRMADFARWVVAAEHDLPWEDGSFITVYLENRASIVELGLEADPVGSSIMTLMGKTEEWTGPATNLLADLNKVAPEHFRRLRAWPKQPNALSNRLRRSATFLREKNYEIEWGKSGQRFISIRRAKDGNAPESKAKAVSVNDDVTLVIEEVA